MSAAAAVVDRNLEAYASGDLESLSATLALDVALGPLYGAALAEGREATRTAYAQTIKIFPMSGTTSLNRISVGQTVIDEERSVRVDGVSRHVATIYSLSPAGISRIATVVDAATPVGIDIAQRQLDAYNAQDLDAFCACYASDVEIGEYPGPAAPVGREGLRSRYAALFGEFPANRVALLNRIAVGGVVVDHERVHRTPEAEPFEVAAVYTVRDGLIARVDFIR